MNLLSLFGCYQRESTNCDLIPCVNLTLEGEYVFFTLFLTNPLSKCCLLLQHEDSVNLLLDNGLTDTKHVVISLSSAQPWSSWAVSFPLEIPWVLSQERVSFLVLMWCLFLGRQVARRVTALDKQPSSHAYVDKTSAAYTFDDFWLWRFSCPCCVLYYFTVMVSTCIHFTTAIGKVAFSTYKKQY